MLRPPLVGLLLLVGCGGNASSDRVAHSDGGAGGGDTGDHGGAGGTSSVRGCDSPGFEDEALDQAARTLAGVTGEWTEEAWAALRGKISWNLTVEGANSLAGLECLLPPGELVLVGGEIEDFSPLVLDQAHFFTRELEFI